MVYHSEGGFGDSGTIVNSLLSRIAEAENVDPVELTPPLYDVVDPELLEEVVQCGDESLCVSFEYREWKAEVRGNGEVALMNLSSEDELYQCICDSCDDKETLEGLTRAQAHFIDHAEKGCEVMLRNLSSQGDPVIVSTPQRDSSLDSEKTTD